MTLSYEAVNLLLRLRLRQPRKIPQVLQHFKKFLKNEDRKFIECSKLANKLDLNAFAQMIASPIRRDALTNARLPLDFLIKFSCCMASKMDGSDLQPAILPSHLAVRGKVFRVGARRDSIEHLTLTFPKILKNMRHPIDSFFHPNMAIEVELDLLNRITVGFRVLKSQGNLQLLTSSVKELDENLCLADSDMIICNTGCSSLALQINKDVNGNVFFFDMNQPLSHILRSNLKGYVDVTAGDERDKCSYFVTDNSSQASQETLWTGAVLHKTRTTHTELDSISNSKNEGLSSFEEKYTFKKEGSGHSPEHKERPVPDDFSYVKISLESTAARKLLKNLLSLLFFTAESFDLREGIIGR